MTARITLALLFIVPAAMAYPWPSPADKWLLGIAVAAAVVLFGVVARAVLHDDGWPPAGDGGSPQPHRGSSSFVGRHHRAAANRPVRAWRAAAAADCRLRRSLRDPLRQGAHHQSRHRRRPHDLDRADASRHRQPRGVAGALAADSVARHRGSCGSPPRRPSARDGVECGRRRHRGPANGLGGQGNLAWSSRRIGICRRVPGRRRRPAAANPCRDTGPCRRRKRGPRWRSPELQPIPAWRCSARCVPTTSPARAGRSRA